MTAPVPAAETAGAIRLDGVGVRFTIAAERILSFKEYVLRRLRRGLEFRDLWALENVDLTIRGGEVFGIVGRNGAGKSTLLKVMARVLQPTTGRVRITGRVAPLLELGAGFHFDLTGRENVFLNGTLLGHSRPQIAARFDEVVDFAELPDFINVPIRTYSSGMLARLGFAVATMLRPDILLIDEVLAVGDAGFKSKCRERIEAFRAAGTSIVLVSHETEAVVEQCDRALWLDQGRVADIGEPRKILDRYSASLAGR